MAVVLLIAVVAVVLVRWLANPAGQHEVASRTGDPQELRAALDQLAREVRELRQAVAERPALISPRTDEARVPADNAEMESLVQRLEAAVAALDARAPESLDELSRPPAGATAALFRELVGHELDEDFDYNGPEKRLEQKHLFWSVHELFREYGPPDEVGHGEVLHLSYRAEESDWKVTFNISNGIVIAVRIST